VTVGPSLADFLHRERVLAGLIDRLDYIASPGPAGSWPPRPGCCEHRDIGIVRAWATIDLAAWLREAPQVFGPHRPHETFDCIGGREANLILDFLRRSRYQLATLSGPCASGLARRLPLPLRAMTRQTSDRSHRLA